MYVFDTSSLSLIGNYFPVVFRGFWTRFDSLVADGRIISVRETFDELNSFTRFPHIQAWLRNHRAIFLPPTEGEAQFIADMFASEPRFQALIPRKAQLQGRRVADPFLIASARERALCLVTEETLRGEAIKIPYVCNHYGIDCTNVEGMLNREGWEF